jgi:hypothetical protein
MILDLPYTGNVLNHPFKFHLKAINGPYPSCGKQEKQRTKSLGMNFERKVTLEKLFTSY